VNLDFSDSSGVMGYMDGEPEMFETETLKKIVQQFYKRLSGEKDGMVVLIVRIGFPSFFPRLL
jgi:hypothetical protein